MTNVEVIQSAPDGFSRIRSGKAEGLGRRIGGKWRAFGWWTGVEPKTVVGVENASVPPHSGKRRPVTDRLLAKLPAMTNRQLAKHFAHSYIFHDPAVADLLVANPELAARCVRAAATNPGFGAAVEILGRIGAEAVPVILEALAQSGHVYHAPHWALALARVDPTALPESAEAQLIAHMCPAGALETWATLKFEALLLAMPTPQRARILAGFNPRRFGSVLYAAPRLRADPAVAQRIVDAMLSWDAKRLDYLMKNDFVDPRGVVRSLATVVPRALVSGMQGAKGLQLAVMADGVALVDTPEAAALCVASVDKPGVAAALRAGIRSNASLATAIAEQAQTGKGKKKAFAAEVLHAQPRDSQIAADDRALADLRASMPDARRDAQSALGNGHVEDWVQLEALATRHGDDFFAVLATEVTELIRTGHHRCNLGRWPTELGRLILLRVGDDRPLVTHAVHEMLVAWGRDAVSLATLRILADRIVADGFRRSGELVTWYEEQRQQDAEVPTFVPLLELMRVGKAKFKGRVADALVAFGPAVSAELAPYLQWPSYAEVAAAVARRVGDPTLAQPLQDALDLKPIKKIRVALEAALATCVATDARQSTAQSVRDAKVVEIAKPAAIEGLQAALTKLGESRRKLPEPGLAIAWRTGAALDQAAERGLWAMLTAAQQCVPTSLMRDVAEALTPQMKDAIVDAALAIQPVSGKKKEVWSLNALALLASEARIARLCDNAGRLSSHSHALAKHLIEALRQRGRGRAVLALDGLTRRGGKRGALAEEALAHLVRTREIDRHQMIDLAYTGDVSDANHLRSAFARFESAMILGRPFRAEHFAAILETRRVLRAAARGLLLSQAGRTLWTTQDSRLVDGSGAAAKLTEAPIRIVHPAALEPDRLQDAIAHAAREGLTPGFAQLSRPVAKSDPAELRATVKAGRKVKYRDLSQRVDARGYGPGEFLDDSNAVMSFVRHLGHGAAIELYHDGGYDPRRVEDLQWTSPFDVDPPGLLSEIALDLQAVLTPPKPRAPVKSEVVLAIDGDYPHAQVSPSGRAKCIHCNDKIAKGVVRVVVERTVEIDGDPRRVNGYLHLACAVPCAEANGLEGAAFVRAMRDNSDDDVPLEDMR